MRSKVSAPTLKGGLRAAPGTQDYIAARSFYRTPPVLVTGPV